MGGAAVDLAGSVKDLASHVAPGVTGAASLSSRTGSDELEQVLESPSS